MQLRLKPYHNNKIKAIRQLDKPLNKTYAFCILTPTRKNNKNMVAKKSTKTSRVSGLNRRISLSVKHIIVVALLFGALGVYSIVQSSAAPTSRIIELSGPTTVSLGSEWTLSAGGFKPNGYYNINVLAGNYVEGGNYTSTGYYRSADSNGLMTVTGTADLPGEYKITVSEIIMQAKNTRSRAVTTAVGGFAVQ